MSMFCIHGRKSGHTFPLPAQVKVTYINLAKEKNLAEIWVSKKKGWEKRYEKKRKLKDA